jgi:hypothetical protein
MNKLSKLILYKNNLKFVTNQFLKFSCTSFKYQEKSKSKPETSQNDVFSSKTSNFFFYYKLNFCEMIVFILYLVVRLNPLEKYLVYTLSHHKYNSVNEVPDFVP